MNKLEGRHQEEISAAQKFADLVAGGKIAQGIACYHTENGEMNYFIINPQSMIYIVGLMEATKTQLLNYKQRTFVPGEGKYENEGN